MMRKVLDNTGQRWITSVRFTRRFKRRLEMAARAAGESKNEFMRRAVEGRVVQIESEIVLRAKRP